MSFEDADGVKDNKRKRVDMELMLLKKPNKVDILTSRVPKPKNALPTNPLPTWENYPLEHKCPIVPAPEGTFELSRNSIGKTLFLNLPNQSFDIADPFIRETPKDYEPLHDPHLKEFFQLHPNIVEHLLEIDLITTDGEVACTLMELNKYRLYLSRVHKNLINEERMEQENLEKFEEEQTKNIKKWFLEIAKKLYDEELKRRRAKVKEDNEKRMSLIKRKHREHPSSFMKDMKARENAIRKAKRDDKRKLVSGRIAKMKIADIKRINKLVLKWICEEQHLERLMNYEINRKFDERELNRKIFIDTKREVQEIKIRHHKALLLRDKMERECKINRRQDYYNRREIEMIEEVEERESRQNRKVERIKYLMEKYGKKWLNLIRRSGHDGMHDSSWHVRRILQDSRKYLKDMSGAKSFTSFLTDMLKPKKNDIWENVDPETKSVVKALVKEIVNKIYKEIVRHATSCTIDGEYKKEKSLIGECEEELNPKDLEEPFVPILKKIHIPSDPPLWPCSGPCAQFGEKKGGPDWKEKCSKIMAETLGSFHSQLSEHLSNKLSEDMDSLFSEGGLGSGGLGSESGNIRDRDRIFSTKRTSEIGERRKTGGGGGTGATDRARSKQKPAGDKHKQKGQGRQDTDRLAASISGQRQKENELDGRFALAQQMIDAELGGQLDKAKEKQAILLKALGLEDASEDEEEDGIAALIAQVLADQKRQLEKERRAMGILDDHELTDVVGVDEENVERISSDLVNKILCEDDALEDTEDEEITKIVHKVLDKQLAVNRGEKPPLSATDTIETVSDSSAPEESTKFVEPQRRIEEKKSLKILPSPDAKKQQQNIQNKSKVEKKIDGSTPSSVPTPIKSSPSKEQPRISIVPPTDKTKNDTTTVPKIPKDASLSESKKKLSKVEEIKVSPSEPEPKDDLNKKKESDVGKEPGLSESKKKLSKVEEKKISPLGTQPQPALQQKKLSDVGKEPGLSESKKKLSKAEEKKKSLSEAKPQPDMGKEAGLSENKKKLSKVEEKKAPPPKTSDKIIEDDKHKDEIKTKPEPLVSKVEKKPPVKPIQETPKPQSTSEEKLMKSQSEPSIVKSNDELSAQDQSDADKLAAAKAAEDKALAEKKRLEEEAKSKAQDQSDADKLAAAKAAEEKALAERKRLEEEAKSKVQDQLDADKLAAAKAAEEKALAERKRLEEEAKSKAQDQSEADKLAAAKAAEEKALAEKKRLEEEAKSQAQQQSDADKLAAAKAAEEKALAEKKRLEEEAKSQAQQQSDADKLAAAKAAEEKALAEKKQLEEEAKSQAQVKSDADKLAAAKAAEEKALAERKRLEEEAKSKAQDQSDADKLAAGKAAEENALAERKRLEEEAKSQAQQQSDADKLAAAKAAEDKALAEKKRLEDEAKSQAQYQSEADKLAASKAAEEKALAERKRLEDEAKSQDQSDADKLAAAKAAEDKAIAERKRLEEVSKSQDQSDADKLAAAKAAEDKALAERKRLEEEAKSQAKDQSDADKLATAKAAEEKALAERKRLEEEAKSQDQSDADKLAAAKTAEEKALAERKRLEEDAKSQVKDQSDTDKLKAAKDADDKALAEKKRLEEEAKSQEQSDADKLKTAKDAENKALAERKRLEEEAKSQDQTDTDKLKAAKDAEDKALAERKRLEKEAKSQDQSDADKLAAAKATEDKALAERKRLEEEAKSLDQSDADKLKAAKDAEDKALAEKKRLEEESKSQAQDQSDAEKLKAAKDAEDKALAERKRLEEEAKSQDQSDTEKLAAVKAAEDKAIAERKRLEEESKSQDQSDADKLAAAKAAEDKALAERKRLEEESKSQDQSDADKLAAAKAAQDKALADKKRLEEESKSQAEGQSDAEKLKAAKDAEDKALAERKRLEEESKTIPGGTEEEAKNYLKKLSDAGEDKPLGLDKSEKRESHPAPTVEPSGFVVMLDVQSIEEEEEEIRRRLTLTQSTVNEMANEGGPSKIITLESEYNQIKGVPGESEIHANRTLFLLPGTSDEQDKQIDRTKVVGDGTAAEEFERALNSAQARLSDIQNRRTSAENLQSDEMLSHKVSDLIRLVLEEQRGEVQNETNIVQSDDDSMLEDILTEDNLSRIASAMAIQSICAKYKSIQNLRNRLCGDTAPEATESLLKLVREYISSEPELILRGWTRPNCVEYDENNEPEIIPIPARRTTHTHFASEVEVLFYPQSESLVNTSEIPSTMPSQHEIVNNVEASSVSDGGGVRRPSEAPSENRSEGEFSIRGEHSDWYLQPHVHSASYDEMPSDSTSGIRFMVKPKQMPKPSILDFPMTESTLEKMTYGVRESDMSYTDSHYHPLASAEGKSEVHQGRTVFSSSMDTMIPQSNMAIIDSEIPGSSQQPYRMEEPTTTTGLLTPEEIEQVRELHGQYENRPLPSEVRLNVREHLRLIRNTLDEIKKTLQDDTRKSYTK